MLSADIVPPNDWALIAKAHQPWHLYGGGLSGFREQPSSGGLLAARWIERASCREAVSECCKTWSQQLPVQASPSAVPLRLLRFKLDAAMIAMLRVCTGLSVKYGALTLAGQRQW